MESDSTIHGLQFYFCTIVLGGNLFVVSFLNLKTNNSAKFEPKSNIFEHIGQWPRQVRMMKKLEVENLIGLSL